MFYSLLIIAGIIVLIWGKKRFAELPPEQRKSALTNWVLIGAAALIVGLVLAGRAPWLMGVLAALMAVAGRVVQLASYMPMFKKLFGQEGPAQSKDRQAQQHGQGRTDFGKQCRNRRASLKLPAQATRAWICV